jgi:signal transduction histidine kinase
LKKIINWSSWSIGTKILVLFLGLSMISMGVIGYVSIVNIRGLGNYALETSSNLGNSAIQDSTAHLNKLGEEIIKQKATDVAKQVELYLKTRTAMTIADMRADNELRQIVVQPVGSTGYTTLIDPVNAVIIIHKYPEQEKNLDSLRTVLPTFWELLKASIGKVASGYYDWLEVNGAITQKYASIVPIKNPGGSSLTLWATTYITEFSVPTEQTKKEINAAIQESSNYINKSVSDVQEAFSIIFTALLIFVIGLALLLARLITSPIQALKSGAEAIGRGNLNYQLDVKTKDELGDLANSFNKMSLALNTYMEELRNTAAENIAKEKQIQDNLRLYVKKVSEAQEAERKRIARELHDETVQALVAVARHLDDLASGKSKLTVQEIRSEIQKILEGVRHYGQDLRPSILDDLGLVPALKWLASDLTKNYGIEVETEIRGNNRQLPADVELALFRITQEAFTNVRKHSQATKVSVKLEISEHYVQIIIHDNGKGFAMPAKVGDLTRMGKLGLMGIKERTQLLNGAVAVDSEPSKGTTLTIKVPL